MHDVKTSAGKLKFLSGATLKYIAMASMLADHFNKAILFAITDQNSPQILYTISDLLSIFGRFAFPIYCFLLVEGFFHTRDKRKLVGGMLVFAVISEIPYNLYFSGTFLQPLAQNIFWTFALALCCIWALDEIRKRCHIAVTVLCGIVITAAGCISAAFTGVDYDFFGILVVMLFYLFRKRTYIASVLSALLMLKSLWAIPALILVNFYNGERGRQSKWLNYWFYPVHLLIIGLLRYFFFNTV